MTTMKERMEAKKLARALGTQEASTTSKSVNILLTSPDAPVRASEDVKQNHNAVDHPTIDKAATPTLPPSTSKIKPNSALKSGAGGLLASAVARRKQGTTVPTSGSVAAKARAALEARNVKESSELHTEGQPDTVGNDSTSSDNTTDTNSSGGGDNIRSAIASVLVNKHRNAEFSDTQSEQISKIVGLDAEELLDDLTMLEEYVVGDCPEIGSFMQRMHTNLRQYAELTHILTEKQIGIVVQSFMKRKNIEITTPTTGSKAKQSVSNMTRGKTKQEVLDML